MSKSIFISSVYEDSLWVDSIRGWAKQNQLGDVAIVSETEDNRHIGAEAIKQHIQNKIRGAALVLVLIGRDTHNHEWIKAEVELANSFHKKIACIRIPNTNGSVPSILINHKPISFNPESLKQVLDNI